MRWKENFFPAPISMFQVRLSYDICFQQDAVIVLCQKFCTKFTYNAPVTKQL